MSTSSMHCLKVLSLWHGKPGFQGQIILKVLPHLLSNVMADGRAARPEVMHGLATA